MIDHSTKPKKQKVGSLFFHLFNRLSVWLYTVLIGSIPARLLTSYDAMEARWTELGTKVLGTPDGKFRQAVHRLRLRCANLMEHSMILRLLDRIVKFFVNCPVNVYGIFFFIYGALGTAVYFVAERLSVNYAGDFGWGISGVIIAVASLPLLATNKPLIKAAFGSRIIGKILRAYVGLEPPLKSKEKERSTTLLVYAALVFGILAGALTFFFHPVFLPVLVLLCALALVILYIPECGILLACATVWLWWATGYSMLCISGIAVVTLISFANKLIRGKRVMHVRLFDFAMLLLVGVFALHGLLVKGDFLSSVYGWCYALLIAMYFPAVNLMRSRDWLNRCYKLLAFSGTILAVISVIPISKILYFLDLTLLHVDLSMFAQLYERHQSNFGQGTLMGGVLVLLLPLMMSRLVDKRTITGLFWKIAWVIAGCAFLLLSMQVGLWIGAVTALLVFFFVYSYRSLSTAMLLAFPVGCGIVWREEIDSLLGVRNWSVIMDMQNAIVCFADGAAERSAIARSVWRMSADHLMGVGFGDHAVYSVFAYYAAPGMEEAAIHNTYLQILAENGYQGLLMLVGVILLFIISVLTYLRWGGNTTTKARVAAGFAGVTGVLVMALLCNLMNNASLFFLFWLVIGLTVASLRTQYETHARAVQTHFSTLERSDIAFRTR